MRLLLFISSRRDWNRHVFDKRSTPIAAERERKLIAAVVRKENKWKARKRRQLIKREYLAWWEAERIEDKIDRDLAGSFPATNPPGWAQGVKKCRLKKDNDKTWFNKRNFSI
jgi:hypothetical protein